MKCERCEGERLRHYEGEAWTGYHCQACGWIGGEGDPGRQAVLNMEAFLTTASESEVLPFIEDYAANYVRLAQLTGPGLRDVYKAIMDMMKAEVKAIRARRDGKKVERRGCEVIVMETHEPQPRTRSTPETRAAAESIMREAKTEREAAERLTGAFPYLTTRQIHAGIMHTKGVIWKDIESRCRVSKSIVKKELDRFYEETGFARPDRRAGMGRMFNYDDKRDGASPDEPEFD